jgi:peptidoglycan/xylan/chitin deacetylase (PgdA/CDA1 family)
MMMIAALKRSSLAVSKHLGLTRVVADSAWRRQRLLILCYHGVSLADEHEWNPGLYIAPTTLANRFAILKRTGCNILRLDEAVRRLYDGTLPDRSVALTFDDGFHDFAALAHPLLEQYGYSSTVYLTTQRCEQNFPVVHLVSSYLLWKHRDATLDARGIAGLNRVYQLTTDADRHRVVKDMVQRMHDDLMYPDDKNVLAREVMSRLPIDYDSVERSRILRIMTPEQVADMSRRGVAIELHTHRHRTPSDPAAFLEEVRTNCERIIAITGQVPHHFCYPSGMYSPTYLPLLKGEGVETATTCDPEMAAKTCDPLLLPRFVDTEFVSDVEFEAWVTGAACWLPRRTRRAHVVH